MLKRLLVVLFVGFSTFANASEPKQALDAFHAALATGDTATARPRQRVDRGDQEEGEEGEQ